MLREEGFAVTASETLAAAIEHVDLVGPPDLLIADYRLPDGAGTDVCRIARSKGVPTLIVYAYPTSLRPAMDAEADGWIAKPFKIEELVAAIRKVLRRV